MQMLKLDLEDKGKSKEWVKSGWLKLMMSQVSTLRKTFRHLQAPGAGVNDFAMWSGTWALDKLDN